MDEAAFPSAIRDEQRSGRRAGLTFAEACRSGDVERMLAAADGVNEEVGAWPYAFRALSKRVSPDIARAFLMLWVGNKSITLDFTRRTDLLRGLRFLFPPYEGGPVKLYRGEAVRRHRSRMWGVSWTTDLATADKFASDDFRRYLAGGSVILETVAPAFAILAKFGQLNKEREFIVDPRKLECVRVVRLLAERQS